MARSFWSGKTGIKVPAVVQTGIDGGRMMATLTPKGNLYYARKYEVRLTNVITDSFANSDGNKANLASFSSTFTTKAPTAYTLADGAFAGRDIALYEARDNNGQELTYAYVMAGTQATSSQISKTQQTESSTPSAGAATISPG